MTCTRCSYDLPDDANFCFKCGADQHSPTASQRTWRSLRRSVTNRNIGGVCGGLAEHLNVDATLVRVFLVIVAAFVPGAVIGAAIAYLLTWLVTPEEKAHGFPDASHQLIRSATNRKVAGVCGGFGEYFSVDPTAVRVLWAVLSICPGFLVGGVIAYVVAWFVMPAPPKHFAVAANPPR